MHRIAAKRTLMSAMGQKRTLKLCWLAALVKFILSPQFFS
jgi:hypothetical protein